MKHLVPACLLMILFITSSFKGDVWQRYDYRAGHFSVLLPGAPDKMPDDNTLGATMHMTEYENDEEGYFVGYTDPKLTSKVPIAKLLEDFKNGMTKGASRVQVISRDVQSSTPYIEFSYKRDGTYFYSRIYFMQKTMYQLMYASARNNYSASAMKFLHSFKTL